MKQFNRIIRDGVHGNLSLNDFEMELLDSYEMQRLRRIKQLGFISLIYPGANHTRFEHSIGTMYLGSKLANHLKLSEHDKKVIRVAALLHDIGHGPYSHVSEGAFEEFKHEELTIKVIKNELSDIISKEFDIKEIIDIFNKKSHLSPIISGDFDVDRLDYLIRDSHYTGVAYGIIDVERVIANMHLKKDLVLNLKGVQAAESVLIARYQMYPIIYQHHTTRIINAMFRRCLLKLSELGELNFSNLYNYDDYDMMHICSKQEGYVKDIFNRLRYRNLFKRVYSLPLNEFETPSKFYTIEKKTLRKCEEEISEDTGINKDYIFLDIPEYPKFTEENTHVSIGERLYPLSEISSIVAALKKARFNYPDISIYVPKEYREEFKGFKLENYLDLPEKSKKPKKSINHSQSKLL